MQKGFTKQTLKHKEVVRPGDTYIVLTKDINCAEVNTLRKRKFQLLGDKLWEGNYEIDDKWEIDILVKFLMQAQVVSGDKSSNFSQYCREYFSVWLMYNFSLKK